MIKKIFELSGHAGGWVRCPQCAELGRQRGGIHVDYENIKEMLRGGTRSGRCLGCGGSITVRNLTAVRGGDIPYTVRLEVNVSAGSSHPLLPQRRKENAR